MHTHVCTSEIRQELEFILKYFSKKELLNVSEGVYESSLLFSLLIFLDMFQNLQNKIPNGVALT